ncbi:MAG: two-component regulator propeller domain-containing protein [Bacteroidota bacterium]
MRRRLTFNLLALLIHLPAFVFAQTPFWDVFDTQNTILPSNEIRSLSFDYQGNLWVATAQGLAKRSDSLWSLTPSFSGIGLDSDFTSTVSYFDGGNSIWVGTQLYGVFKLDGANWVQQGPAFTGVKDLLNDPDDASIWVASENGLRKFDSNANAWTVFNDSTPRFPSPFVTAVKKGPQGNIWVGTYPFGSYPGGLAWYDGVNWFTINRSDGLPNSLINDFTFDQQGKLWIATDLGVVKQNANSWQTFTPNNSALPNIKVNTIELDSLGNIWAGTEGGIGVNTSRGWTNFKTSNSGLPDNRIRDIVIDIDGTAWIATQNGVAHFDRILNTSTSIDTDLADVGHQLKGPFPNPIRSGESFFLDLELAFPADVELSLLNLKGQVLKRGFVATKGQLQIHQEIEWSAGLAKGFYLLQVKLENAQSTRKILIQ